MSAESHVAFLLACIKHTQAGGKIDFDAVASELNIKTKAAAAKRYERLKKKALSGTSLAAMAGDGGTPETPPKKTTGRAAKASSSSKRKRSQGSDSDEEEDADIETPDKGTSKTTGSSRPKRRQAEKAASAIKREAEADSEVDEADDDE